MNEAREKAYQAWLDKRGINKITSDNGLVRRAFEDAFDAGRVSRDAEVENLQMLLRTLIGWVKSSNGAPDDAYKAACLEATMELAEAALSSGTQENEDEK